MILQHIKIYITYLVTTETQEQDAWHKKFLSQKSLAAKLCVGVFECIQKLTAFKRTSIWSRMADQLTVKPWFINRLYYKTIYNHEPAIKKLVKSSNYVYLDVYSEKEASNIGY